MRLNSCRRAAITLGVFAVTGGLALMGCSAPVRGTPTPFSLGGASQVLGFTPTPTASTPRIKAPAPAPGGGGGEAGGGASDDPGKKVFQTAGCAACHTLTAAGATGNVGPNLDGVGTRAGTRKPGTDAEAYIRESLLRPAAFIVPSFPPVMPEGLVKEGPDLDALVKFLLEQK